MTIEIHGATINWRTFYASELKQTNSATVPPVHNNLLASTKEIVMRPSLPRALLVDWCGVPKLDQVRLGPLRLARLRRTRRDGPTVAGLLRLVPLMLARWGWSTEAGLAEAGPQRLICWDWPAEDGPSEDGPNEVGIAEAGPTEAGPTEDGHAEDELTELCPTEASALKLNPVRLDAFSYSCKRVGLMDKRRSGC